MATNIYGIFSEKDLNLCIYVGETIRDPKVRFAEHRRNLHNGSHTNKSLQKYYDALDSKDDIRFEVLSTIDTENSLLKHFYECLWISNLRPKCCKCVISHGGKNQVVLQRCEPDIAKKIIDCIQEVV